MPTRAWLAKNICSGGGFPRAGESPEGWIQALRRRRRTRRVVRPPARRSHVWGSGMTLSVPFARKVDVFQNSPLVRDGSVPRVAPVKLPVVKSRTSPKVPL